MSVSVSIVDAITGQLGAFGVDLSGEGPKNAAGDGVRVMLINYLRGLDASRPNKLGGRRTHYYDDLARGVTYDITPDGASVHVTGTGVALHYYGGVVKPGPGKRFLTIPVDPAAYGRRAGEFNNLEIAWGKTGAGKPRPIGLVTKSDYVEKTRKNRKTGVKEVVRSYEAGRWMYALVYSATIPEDKTILPDADSLSLSAVTAVNDYVISKMRGPV